jgi:F0F1-type ATP synthase assembly protein I
MNKKAAPKTTTTSNLNDKQSTSDAIIAKTNFIATASSMSWQLAIVFLVPIIGGYYLDDSLKSSPLFLLIGFVLALSASFLIIRKFYVEFNKVNSKTGDKK